MIGEYEIFPFHNSKSAIEILEKELPIDRFSQRYVLWTLQEHGELCKRFRFLDNKIREIKEILENQPFLTFNINDQYSIRPMITSRESENFVKSILNWYFSELKERGDDE